MSDQNHKLPWGSAADAFSPFSSEDEHSLRAFVADVRELSGMRFFDQVSGRFTVTLGSKDGAKSDAKEPDNEALRAAITMFRQLYVPSEDGSFRSNLNRMKRSARQRKGPATVEARELLNEYASNEKKIVDGGIGMGLVLGERKVSNWEIVDAYMHGKYLHGQNEKTKLVEALDSIPAFPRQTFYMSIYEVTAQYSVFANLIEIVLDELGADPGD